MTSRDTTRALPSPDSSRRPAEQLRARFAEPPGRGTLHGGWWPHSRDIDLELADLVDHFPAVGGRVIRALYSRPDWDSQPDEVAVADRWLETGSLPGDDAHTILLSTSAETEVRLLVVPPGHPCGEQAMTIAADPANRWSALQILAAGEFDEDDGTAQDHWTDDGGAWWSRPEAGPPSYR